MPSFSNVQDLLLAEVAVRIQLSATNYGKAVARYKALASYLEREGSLLAGLIALFYPQGSMAIGATIASRLTTDKFDVDFIAQLMLNMSVTPSQVLDLLYKAIRSEPGSRYYGCVERRCRCVTVTYADGMHIDITPMIRRDGTPERESVLFHHKHETPHIPGYRCIANPFGFAEWFKANTPQEIRFADEYEALAKSLTFDEAPQDPIPEQEHLYRKSMALIVLQLLKRFRNVRYDRRLVRRPPSVMLTKLVADHAGHTRCLSDELLYQTQRLRDLLVECASAGTLIEVRNPVCPGDVFTDRWPAHASEQDLFIEDLDHLVDQVERLKSGCELEEMRGILSDLFGESPSTEAVKALEEQLGTRISNGSSLYVPSRSVATGSAALVGLSAGTSAYAQRTPPHRFYGD
ncbi:MAG: nucleotidyltransferase domain-containing protein [Panacagrimonas sp.]